MKKRIKIHDNWQTPNNLYHELHKVFDFNFDPCPLNHDITAWDGLHVDWGTRNYINPPYTRKLKEAFVLKAVEESKKNKLCVLCLPVSTSTKLFHDVIIPNARQIAFIKGRPKFIGVDTYNNLVDHKGGMHDTMIVVFGKSKKYLTNNHLFSLL